MSGDRVETPGQTRARRLREDAKRSASENLAEAIALSHQLLRIEREARRSR